MYLLFVVKNTKIRTKNHSTLYFSSTRRIYMNHRHVFVKVTMTTKTSILQNHLDKIGYKNKIFVQTTKTYILC